MATLISAISWRRTFELFGVIGVIWAVLFFRWFRDAPSEHPRVNQAELALLPPAKLWAHALKTSRIRNPRMVRVVRRCGFRVGSGERLNRGGSTRGS